MIPLPAYINQEAWQGFVDMRKAMGRSKPFTTRAAVLILYELQRLKDAGHDPNTALDQSTLRGWADVYPPKDKPIEHIKSRASETRVYLNRLDEQRAAALSASSQDAARVAKLAMSALKVVGR